MTTAWSQILGQHVHPLILSGGPEGDAFSRFRVSKPTSLFSAAQIYDNLPLLYETVLTGSGSSTYTTGTASTVLAVTTSSGSAIRQSKYYVPYRAGNSQTGIFTFCLGSCAAGVVKRIGMFDAANGIFLEQTNSGLFFVIRSSTSGSPVDTRVAQANWNLDVLDGSNNPNNPTGITLDKNSTQIFFFDMQWLGVGRVRFGFDIGGEAIPVHTVDHANNSLTLPYMGTPALPVRYEISNSNVGGYNAGSLTQICAAIIREGDSEDTGYIANLDNGTTSVTAASGTLTSMFAIRLKSSHIRSRLSPKNLGILNTSANPIRYCLSLNPTTTGSFASWTSRGATYASEYSMSVLPVTDPGMIIESGYMAANSGTAARGSSLELNLSAVALDVLASVAGTSDVLCFSAAGIGGAATVYGALSWSELF